MNWPDDISINNRNNSNNRKPNTWLWMFVDFTIWNETLKKLWTICYHLWLISSYFMIKQKFQRKIQKKIYDNSSEKNSKNIQKNDGLDFWVEFQILFLSVQDWFQITCNRIRVFFVNIFISISPNKFEWKDSRKNVDIYAWSFWWNRGQEKNSRLTICQRNFFRTVNFFCKKCVLVLWIVLKDWKPVKDWKIISSTLRAKECVVKVCSLARYADCFNYSMRAIMLFKAKMHSMHQHR